MQPPPPLAITVPGHDLSIHASLTPSLLLSLSRILQPWQPCKPSVQPQGPGAPQMQRPAAPQARAPAKPASSTRAQASRASTCTAARCRVGRAEGACGVTQLWALH